MATTYAIPDGRVAMAATLYTGTGAALSANNAVNGVSFQPDFVWIKPRSLAYAHNLGDSVRGVNNTLSSNSTGAENYAGAGDITAFNTNGFSIRQTSNWELSSSGATYVGWQWKAGGTAVTNTAGSITSSVSANTTAGFSVVTYTGTGANATVGHGLGVAPSMFIVKRRNSAGLNWGVYHISLTSASYVLVLQGTDAQALDTTYWNATAPTSSLLNIGTAGAVNASGGTYVAYCFAPVAGYSAFGSYTGNGSADGPFVYTAMRPRFLMVKRTDSTGNWTIVDTSRNTSNVVTNRLYADLSNAEDTDTPCDALSNGFKVRMTATSWNASGGTYIYMAFAENPFKYANAR